MDNIIPFKEIEHTADLGLQIFGRNVEELFKHAHLGFYALALGSLKNFQQAVQNSSGGKKEKGLQLTENTPEDLLISFLSELNFNLQVNKIIFAPLLSLKISQQNNRFILNMKSGLIVLKNNFLHNLLEIKAVTYHDLKIVKKDDLLTVTVIFDI